MNLVETYDLTHSFGRNPGTLKSISMQVPEGSIYGFLGANGAGKATTLRLLLGLLKKQHGEIRIFGRTMERERIGILRNIGSIIETPSVYEHLTANENLRVHQKIYHCPKERIGEILDIVGLGHTGKKTAKQFSLGMKQRLALGIALLHKPSLLILDEPTNGLDPNGIMDIRNLLVRINQNHGVTIILSSHILAEIEKIATHVGIIKTGRLLFQGTLTELLNHKQKTAAIELHTHDNEQANRLLQTKYPATQLHGNRIHLPVSGESEAAAINAWLVTNGIQVFEMRQANTDLESVFMELTNQ